MKPQNTHALSHWPQIVAISALIVLVLLAGLFTASYFIGPIIRSNVERTMNSKLKGYHTQVAQARLRLIDGNLTLSGVTLVQDAHPNPPVARISQLVMHIEWGAIFTGHVVADVLMSHPRLHIDLTQLRQEQKDKVPVTKKGWQDALQSIYPFKINSFRIEDGDIVYVDVNPANPLYLSRLNLQAGNIRNLVSADRPILRRSTPTP